MNGSRLDKDGERRACLEHFKDWPEELREAAWKGWMARSLRDAPPPDTAPWQWLIVEAEARGDTRAAEALRFFKGQWQGAIDEARWQASRRVEIERQVGVWR